MKLRIMLGIIAATGLPLLWLTTGCSLSDEKSNEEVSGTWAYSDTMGTQSKLVLVQSDDDSLVGASTDGATAKGVVSGDSIAMTLSYSGGTIAHLLGTISGDTMGGTFTNTAAITGAWTALRSN